MSLNLALVVDFFEKFKVLLLQGTDLFTLLFKLSCELLNTTSQDFVLAARLLCNPDKIFIFLLELGRELVVLQLKGGYKLFQLLNVFLRLRCLRTFLVKFGELGLSEFASYLEFSVVILEHRKLLFGLFESLLLDDEFFLKFTNFRLLFGGLLLQELFQLLCTCFVPTSQRVYA